MDNRNPYKVPEGYFDELNAKILQQTIGTNGGAKWSVEFNPKKKSEGRGESFRSFMGFAAGFAIMVGLAWGGFYLMLGGEAQSSGDDMVNELLYSSTSESIYEAFEESDEDEDLFAEAVIEYVDMYGIDEIESLYAEN